jgi:hypothetical protein
MYAILQHHDPRGLVEAAPQDVLSRAFTLTRIPHTDSPGELPEAHLHELADAVRTFMVMGAHWNRPDLA